MQTKQTDEIEDDHWNAVQRLIQEVEDDQRRDECAAMLVGWRKATCQF